MEEVIGKKLYPTYNYVRIYYKGQELLPHTDRDECEYSISVQLAKPGNWPFWIQGYKDDDMVSYEMESGDCIIYDGVGLNHCRKTCPVDWYLQAFIHYVDVDGPYKNTAYDGRDFNIPLHFNRKYTESKKELRNANRLCNFISN